MPAISSIFAQVWRTGAAYAGLKLGALIVGALAGIINARQLGPENLGIWVTATIALLYLPFLNFGVDHGAFQEIPLWRGRGQLAEAKEVKQVYFTSALLLGSLASLGLIFFTLVVQLTTFMAWSLRVVALMGCINVIGRWAIILLKADNRFGRAGMVESFDALGRVLACPLIYLWGLPGIWLGNLAAVVASCGIAWRATGFCPRLRWNMAVFRRLARFGLPIMMVSLAQILSTSGDKMLVLGFLGTSAVGIYGLGQSFTQFLQVTGGIIGPVLYPRITECYGQTHDPSALKDLVVLPTLMLGAIIPIFLGCCWFTLPLLINFLLPAFQAGVLPAQLLFVAVSLYLVAGTSDYLLVALGRQILSMWLFFAGVLLALIMEFLALWLGWGLVGVAAGVAVSNLLHALAVLNAALYFCRAARREQLITVMFAFLPVLVVSGACLVLYRFWPGVTASLLWPAISSALIRVCLICLLSFPLAILVLNRVSPRWALVFFSRRS